MEFFAEIQNVDLDADGLKHLLKIENLASLCDSISTVVSHGEDGGVMFCIWGEFEVRRDEIRYGVRFSLPNCPNALAWTVTFDEASKSAVIHCTIDRKEHDEDFVASIREFVDGWSEGILKASRNNT
ncbi:MAG TPA: hypothetical protein ENJ80_02385 [Gammaproteobacteria bacterium]|nr:hypothetical protein [Gammaproteobacteria bacterium]